MTRLKLLNYRNATNWHKLELANNKFAKLKKKPETEDQSIAKIKEYFFKSLSEYQANTWKSGSKETIDFIFEVGK